jgi:sugar lactone lactonase YvrE
LAFDLDGNLYVSECSWTFAAIERIDPDGTVTRFAGTSVPGFSGDGGPATSAQLYCPAGLAVGHDGSVYFADHVNNRVRRVDAAGTITTFAGSGPPGLGMGSFSGDGGPASQATLQEPWGVALDQAGRLYIADRDNARVRRVDLSGVITTVAGTGAHGSAGDGAPATQAQMCPPIGVAIDPAGNLVIPDACTTAIRMVDGNGIITTIAKTDSSDWDTGSEGNAIFDSNGSMFVQAGLKIFNIDSAGVVKLVAGNGSDGVPIDGSSAIDAPLPLEIWGLALDAAGNLYVADGATSVFRIDDQGIITRFAGRQH